ncbi:tyrosine-protein kinase Fer [Biomphalaria pfeifferi]|uniref:Tyrosine-protein kinase Fer n=1 Tax=Biomphalaria pfeifferi TaxID=112525 RepID=A0AAD8FJY5_BIOPF|nr:tyrosine-protein kinase Fer [Biomphalaria pfeifferi]
MEDIGDFLRKELERELENQKFQYSAVSSSAVSVSASCVTSTSNHEKNQMLEKYHSILFQVTDDCLDLTPCQVEHLLGAIVSKLSPPIANNNTLKVLFQLLNIVKRYIHNTYSFEEVIMRNKLPGKLLQLCTLCIEEDFSPNSRRILMKIKQITFDILTHLIFSTTLISQELTDKDILNAIENVLASPEFHQDKETNKEIKMARADIKRDIVLILSSVVRNIDLRENSLLNIKFEQILKKTLVDQDTLVHDLSLLLSAYVQNDFFKFLKEMSINYDGMLQSLLSHLRFYATYSIVNSKVEIQILAYLEGLEKLATFEEIKKKMKDMSVLKKLYCIIKELGSSKCYVAFVRIQCTLDFFQAEEKNQETTETEDIKRLQVTYAYTHTRIHKLSLIQQ